MQQEDRPWYVPAGQTIQNPPIFELLRVSDTTTEEQIGVEPRLFGRIHSEQ